MNIPVYSHYVGNGSSLYNRALAVKQAESGRAAGSQLRLLSAWVSFSVFILLLIGLFPNARAQTLPCGYRTLTVNNYSNAGVVSGRTGGIVSVGAGTVNNPGNVVNALLTDFATINTVLGVGNGGRISVNANQNGGTTVFGAGATAGYVLGSNSTLAANLMGSTTISTYLNGTLQESSTAATLLNLQILSGTGQTTLGFVTTKNFDEVQISIATLVSAITTTQVYYPFVQYADLTVSATATNTSSPLVSDGSVSVSATGGRPPYASYTYTGPSTSTTTSSTILTGRATGSYTVTVTDANGCTATAATTVGYPAPFTCTPNIAYLVSSPTSPIASTVRRINLTTGATTVIATDVTSGTSVNAMGFNPTDNYLWAALNRYNPGTGATNLSNAIVRFDANFTPTYYRNVTVASGTNSADIDKNGVYHLYNGNSATTVMQRINLSSGVPTQLANLTLSQSIPIGDMAFNPIDNNLYSLTATGASSLPVLYRITVPSSLTSTVTTATVTRLGTVSGGGINTVPASNTATNTRFFGAVYMDSDGNFYVQDNYSGDTFKIPAVHLLSSGQNATATFLSSTGLNIADNDGARCPTAQVAPEASFAFNCATATIAGSFTAGGGSSQAGTLTIPITSATAGIASFSVAITAAGFTSNPAPFSTTLTAGQTSVTVPIIYDGSGTPGSRTVSFDSEQATNSGCSITVSITGRPDLTTSFYQLASEPVANQANSLSITINNIGNIATFGATTSTITLPANVTAPATFTTNGFSCTTSGTLVSCTTSATLAAGASTNLAIPFTPGVATIGTFLSFTNTVATSGESNTNNNTATITLTSAVVGQPDLITSISQPVPTLVVGQTSSLPISVSNIGTAVTSGPITQTLTIPASVTAPAAFTSNGFSCTTVGGLVSCSTAATLATGTSTTFAVPITPLSAGASTTQVFSTTVATDNESNKANNTATLSTGISASVTAGPDSGTVSAGTGGTAVADVRANDVVNSQPATSVNSTLSLISSQNAGITLNTTTGSVSVAIGTTPGSYTLAYQLCDKLTPTTCTTGLVTITVTPSITASPDAGTASAGTGGTAVADVRTNDVVNGQAATSANSSLSVVSTSAGITLNTTTGSVSVAQGTTPGSYTLTYQLCSTLSSTTCTTSFVSLTVAPSVTASPDAGTASAGTGGTAVADVRTNDVVNGQAATSVNSTLSLISSQNAGITLNTTTGSVSVAQGTTPGSYTLSYQLCDRLTPTTCTTALATITVTPSITASPDSGTVSAGTGGTAVADVRTNDVVNGQAATSANSSLSVVSTSAGITLNTTTGSVSVAQGTAPGSYTLTYQLCSTLGSTTCTTSFVSLTVAPSVTASPDAGTASAGTSGTAVADVRTNDLVNGVLPTTVNSTLSLISSQNAGITLNTTTGSVSVAQGTTPGSYTLAYQLCDKLTPTTCTTALATITVTPSAVANPDAGTASAGTGGTAVANVRTNDVVNGQAATSANSSLSLVSTSAGITLNTTTGSVSVAQGTAPGSYTLTYQLCSTLGSTTCTTSFVSLTVTPSVTASPDAGTASAGTGGTAVADVRTNDVVNGQAATSVNSTLSLISSQNAGITLNTTTGSVSVAAGTSPGSYTLVYQICTIATPVICTTATATVTVLGPDLTIAIGQPVPGLLVGQPSNLPVTISNIGPVPTSGPVSFTLSIPATITASASFTSNGFTCATSGTVVSCSSSATLTSGASTTVQVPITPLPAAAGTSPILSATVATANESNLNNNTATTTAGPVAAPDLTILIGQASPTLVVGQTSTVPVSISNIGTAPTSGLVSFTLSVPASVTVPATFTSNGFGCTTSGTLVSCSTSATLTNGASTTVLVPVTPLPAAAGTSPLLSATVAVANEGNTTNNTAATTITPAVVAPDLTVSISQPSPVLVAGQSSAVSITISNIGTTTTQGPVSFTLSIPSTLTVASSFSSNGFTCATSGTLVSCSSSATIASGASTTLVIPITPLNSAVGTSPVLSGTVATAAESNVNNNTAVITVTTPVAGQPDLVVSIGQPSPNLTVGQISSVPVSLSNIGTAPTAGPVSFTLTIPANVTASATFSSNGFTCATSGTLVSCSSPAAITNGASTTVLVPITPLAAATGTSPILSATVATGNESNPNNNTATTTVTTPVVAPDLIIAIGQPIPNLTVTQTSSLPVSLSNIGTASTSGLVSFTLSIPASMTAPATFTNNGYSCTTSGTLVSCSSSATITSGGSTTVLVPITPLTALASTSQTLSVTVATPNESNVNNNTATTSVTISASVVASPDAGTASAGTGGTAVADVRTNDLVNGQAATSANSTLSLINSQNAGITLNTTTGSVSVAIGTTPGSYTLSYQLCDKLTPTTCTTALATITVTPSAVANPDAGTASAGTGGTAVANVRTNDVVNGQAATSANSSLSLISSQNVGITLNTTTGSVSVAQGTAPGNYTLTYQLCSTLGSTTCTTGLVSLTVTSSLTASPDAGTVSAGTGGTAVANVAANDVVNGAPATLGGSGNATLASVGTYPSGITLNTTTGSVSVAQGTTPGSYTLAYQLCDKLTPTTCTTALATITVTPSAVANPDAGTASAGTGGTAVADVRVNDLVNGTLPTTANSSLSVVSTSAGITLNTTTGSVSVAQGTAPGSYTLTYQLCSTLGSTTCTTSFVSLTVAPSVTASPDAGTASAGTGGTAVADVRTNDVVNGQAATSVNSTLSLISSQNAGITLNTTTGSVSVAIGTTPGSYTLSYQLCDRLTPTTCTTALATITVTPSAVANPDAGTASAGTGGTAVANVRTNDVVNGAPATSANSSLSLVSTSAGITLNTTTGSVSVAQGTAPGNYTLTYQLCSTLGSTTCTTGLVSLTVTSSLTASPDAGTVSAGTGGTAVANVAANDVVNGAPATLGGSGNATLASVGTYPSGITLNTTTGSVSVAQGTTPGSYTLAYQLCDKLTPTTCTTALATITVTPSITASPDAGSVIIGTGAIAVLDVRTNDVVNGQAATSANSSLSLISSQNVGITLNTTTGSVSVAQGTAPGNYTLTYQLCSTLGSTTCTTSYASVTVTGNPPVATPDIADTRINTPVSGNVLTNDTDPQGLPLTASLLTPPASGTVVINPDGSYTYTPPANLTGTVSFCYSVSNIGGLSSSACVVVAIAPDVIVGNNAPIANNDNTKTTQNTPVNIAALANDTDPDSATSLAGQLTNPVILSQPAQGTAVVNADGTVTYTPPANFTGVVSFPYQVCDKVTPALCATAIISVNIQPTPPTGTIQPPTAIDDGLFTKRNTARTGNVSFNDSDPQGLALTYTTGQPGSGTVVMSPTGSYTYTPALGFSGPTSFTYSVCNSAGKCALATTAILVQAPAPLISLLPQVYLQGALFGVSLPGVLMRDDLRLKGYIPLTHPYAYLNPITATAAMNPSVTAVTGADAIVDWIFVELRNSFNPSIIVDSRAALLQRDGDIVDVDGVSPVLFSQVNPGSYYVAVRHRNHLGVMSLNALPLSTTTTTVDFRNPNTPTFTYTGTASYTQAATDQAQVVVQQGVAMWAGNATLDNANSTPHNSVIFQGTNNDVNTIYGQVTDPTFNILASPIFKLRGYRTGDVNLNGETISQGTGNDIEFIYQNIINNHPGNVLKLPYFTIREQLP